MVMCKIKCPSCEAEHDVPFESLSAAKILECNLCGTEFPLKSEEKSQPKKPSKKTKTQNKFATQKKPAVSSAIRAIRKPTAKSPVKRKKSQADSTKYVVNLCIGGLALVIVLVAIVKLAGSKKTTDTHLAKTENQKGAIQETSTNNLVKAEIADLKKELQSVKKSKAVPTSVPGVSVNGESVALESYGNSSSSPQEPQAAVDAPVFGGGGQADEEIEPKPAVSQQNTAPVQQISETVTAKTILIPSEQRELEELDKLPSYEITVDEQSRLTELKNKYLWFKANRFKLTREQMEYEWDRRWSSIEGANKMAKSRTDAMLPRPLQILLAKAKTQKERAYMMRVYQKPISFEEKEMVRKARGQAVWERRKTEGPQRYPEDRRKKKNTRYVDEYGYEYFLDDNGQRVYL